MRHKSLGFLDTAAPHYAKSRAFDLAHLFPGSSVVERRTVNALVGGSNPSRGAIYSRPTAQAQSAYSAVV